MAQKTSSHSGKRLPNQTRRRQIIEQSISFFAEQGFGASTRELAERIGITQPLLFQHFSTKQALIQAIFDTLFERMASKDWGAMLHDRNKDLRSRLIDFFSQYAAALYDNSWIRIYMFSGLAGGAFNRLYIASVTEPLLREVAVEIRASLGVPHSPSDVSAAETELLWILHGGLYYTAIRRHIYGMDSPSTDLAQVVEAGVDSILHGMKGLAQRAKVPGGRKNRRVVAE